MPEPERCTRRAAPRPGAPTRPSRRASGSRRGSRRCTASSRSRRSRRARTRRASRPVCPTIRPPSRSANLASVPAPGRAERDRARGAPRRSLRRPPRAGRQVRSERRDAQHAREIQPEHDEHDSADPAEERQVVDERPREVRRRHAEEREHRAEPDDVRDGVAHGQPARRARRRLARRPRPPRAGRGTPGRAAARTARGSSAAPRRARPRWSAPLAEQPPQLADAHDQLDPLVAELDDRDALEVAPVELGVVLDVPLDHRRDRLARAPADRR